MTGHQLSADAGWGGEVSLAGLSALAGNAYKSKRLSFALRDHNDGLL